MAKEKQADTKTAERGQTQTTETPPPAGAAGNAPASQSQGTQAQGEKSHVPDGTVILKKMGPKQVMGRIKRPNLGDPTATPPVPPDPERDLYVVMGQANGMVDGEGDNGPWVGFRGWFESVRCDTGEIAQSALCFVPKSFEELLAATIRQQQGTDGSAMVEFAIKVSIIPSEKAAVGYEYRVRNLIKAPERADPLKALRDSLRSAGSLPALPAPKAAA